MIRIATRFAHQSGMATVDFTLSFQTAKCHMPVSFSR